MVVVIWLCLAYQLPKHIVIVVFEKLKYDIVDVTAWLWKESIYSYYQMALCEQSHCIRL